MCESCVCLDLVVGCSSSKVKPNKTKRERRERKRGDELNLVLSLTVLHTHAMGSPSASN